MGRSKKCNQKEPRKDENAVKRAGEGAEGAMNNFPEKSKVDGTDPKKSDELVKLVKDLASCVVQTGTNGIIRDDSHRELKICSLQRIIPEGTHFDGTYYYLLTMTIPLPRGTYKLIPIEQISNKIGLESANVVTEHGSDENLGNSVATECTTEISGDSEATENTDDTSSSYYSETAEGSDDSSDQSDMDNGPFLCCDQCRQADFSAAKKRK
ncbi:uncharacterized protein LOC119689297 isoform X2 [Teleopsis dalmanni]|uniref:uncharacterized protein LOC119689297 isoform X2 n=1 Tax=Teleopsis dalmanni TaxID=139649 RepID=UPI0018CF3262|nr:uncharacterized protein LOC119689297 isoform X2 [Teleopsis dalmanni]